MAAKAKAPLFLLGLFLWCTSRVFYSKRIENVGWLTNSCIIETGQSASNAAIPHHHIYHRA